jgi:Flp pilus assembly protein CpaB
MLAAAAAVGVYLYQGSADEKEPTQASLTVPSTPTPRPTVAVLIANQDIAVSTTITGDMVEVRQVLPEDKNIRALSSVEEAVGKVTTDAILQGEQVLNSRLTDGEGADAQANTFAYNVPAGKRATSLTYEEVTGAGGLVQPGDRVDVIAYFKVKVRVPSTDLEIASINGESSDDENSEDEKKTEDIDEFVSVFIVQDVEVLAVAQALSPDDAGIDENGEEPTPTPTADPDSTAVAAAETEGEPVARPKAASVTLALDPDQAQRVLLAEVTAESFRLALRAPGDTTTYTLPPAQTGPYSLDQALGDLDEPFIPSDLMITNVDFTKRVLSAGEVLEFTVTVKNTSGERTIRTDEATPAEYQYNQGEAYDTLGFFPENRTYRIGLNFAGAYPTQYPYRWDLGKDLGPGETATIKGSVKLTETTPATRYWFGVIREPDYVSQDGFNVTDITVLPAAAAKVAGDVAQLRKEPAAEALVTKELKKDDYLTVLETQGDWFRVEGPGGSEGWIETAAVQVVPPIASDPTNTSDQTDLFD